MHYFVSIFHRLGPLLLRWVLRRYLSRRLLVYEYLQAATGFLLTGIVLTFPRLRNFLFRLLTNRLLTKVWLTQISRKVLSHLWHLCIDVLGLQLGLPTFAYRVDGRPKAWLVLHSLKDRHRVCKVLLFKQAPLHDVLSEFCV